MYAMSGAARAGSQLIIVSAPTPGYTVTSKDWSHVYRRVREACGIGDAGYVVREAAEWQPYRERWSFFPRKTSTEPFHETSWLTIIWVSVSTAHCAL